MKELIEFQKEIKNWDIEELLDKLCSESYWASRCYGMNEEVRKEHENKVFILKMEIASRTKED